jgi:hypothetical protein
LKKLPILAAILAALITSSGASQTVLDSNMNWIPSVTPIRCSINNLRYYVEGLNAEYGETPLLLAGTRFLVFIESNNDYLEMMGVLTLLTNQNTGTYSILVVFEDGSFCELSTGAELSPYVN